MLSACKACRDRGKCRHCEGVGRTLTANCTFCVLERLIVFMLFVLFLTGCGGQRAFRYKLHNPQTDGQYSTLHRMPDGALLMVSKRLAQPQQIWNLVRVAAWDTSQPHE